VGDVTAPIDEHTHLATGLVGETGQVPRELLGDEPLRGEASPTQAFELADLAGLEALRVSEDADGRDLGGVSPI
jgi:hypothetical protein